MLREVASVLGPETCIFNKFPTSFLRSTHGSGTHGLSRPPLLASLDLLHVSDCSGVIDCSTDFSIALVLLPGLRKGESAFSGSASDSFCLGGAALVLARLDVTRSAAG